MERPGPSMAAGSGARALPHLLARERGGFGRPFCWRATCVSDRAAGGLTLSHLRGLSCGNWAPSGALFLSGALRSWRDAKLIGADNA